MAIMKGQGYEKNEVAPKWGVIMILMILVSVKKREAPAGDSWRL
jgi:hypothetical protein